MTAKRKAAPPSQAGTLGKAALNSYANYNSSTVKHQDGVFNPDESQKFKVASEVIDRGVLTPIYEQAEQHLTLLAEGVENFTFQTFVDDGSSKQAHIFNGTLDEHWNTLVELNNHGHGIYVTVNGTNLQGRKKTDIIKIRAFWRENDIPGLPELPVEPHIVIESSPGKFHEYFLTYDCPLNQFEPIQERLVFTYGSDLNAKDRSRGTPLLIRGGNHVYV